MQESTGHPPLSAALHNSLTRMMELILKLNNFSFNGENYLQVQGTAMGTRMAPSYANLFMAALEKQMLLWTSSRPWVWWRYIDDVFAIWHVGEERLTTFLEEVNSYHPTIKFTAEHSTDRVTFLDTTVILEGDSVRTDLYTKPTDTHQYLLPTSCHPKQCTTSIPYSQSLRLRRICSRDEDFVKRSDELKTHLTTRGYEETIVDAQIQRAASVSRPEALQPHPRNTRLRRVPFVTTFQPGLNRLRSITRRHLPTLHISERLQSAFPAPPIVAFRRAPNLRDLLVRAELKSPAPPTTIGNSPCGNRRCKTCVHIMSTNNFRSNSTGRTYKLRASFTCKTRNVVYLIQCKKCGIQYVGETEKALHIRLNGHRSDVKTRKLEKPVAAHFNLPDHDISDLQIMGIERINTEYTRRRKERESYWIFELQCLAPRGLNLDEGVL